MVQLKSKNIGKKAKVPLSRQAKLALLRKEVEDQSEQENEEEKENEEAMEVKANSKRKQIKNVEKDAKKSKFDSVPEEVKEQIQRTLCVKNLPHSAEKEEIAKLFKGVKEVRICRRQKSSQSSGSCFIEFNCAEEKESALAMKDEVKLQERTLSLHNAAWRTLLGVLEREKNNELTILCKNLPYSAKEKQVASLFKGVKEVRILGDVESGRSNGVSFVVFNSKEEKESALSLRDQVKLDGRPLYIDDCGGDSNARTYFLKGISKDMTEDSILAKIDGAVCVRIPKFRDTRKNRDFAFVEFDSEDNAKSWYAKAKDGFNIDGTMLVVGNMRCEKEDFPQKTLYVKGLTKDMTKDSLIAHFPGAVDVRIYLHKDTGEKMDFGHLEFESESDATSAYETAKDGIDVNGVTLKVERSKGSRGSFVLGRGHGFGRRRRRGRGVKRSTASGGSNKAPPQ